MLSMINELVDRDDKDREIVCHMMKIVKMNACKKDLSLRET